MTHARMVLFKQSVVVCDLRDVVVYVMQVVVCGVCDASCCVWCV